MLCYVDMCYLLTCSSVIVEGYFKFHAFCLFIICEGSILTLVCMFVCSYHFVCLCVCLPDCSDCVSALTLSKMSVKLLNCRTRHDGVSTISQVCGVAHV